MDVAGIAPIGLPALTSPTNEASARRPFSFERALGQAMHQLDTLQTQADQHAIALATGQDVDLADVVLATERAALGFQLAIQIRNRVVEAYQEIVRMQI